MNPAFLGAAAALAWGTHDFAARFPSQDIGPRRFEENQGEVVQPA